LRDSAAPPGARSAATRPSGFEAQSVKTLNSLAFTSSATSVSSSAMRRSGLSEP
jgi:hypothetical protein